MANISCKNHWTSTRRVKRTYRRETGLSLSSLLSLYLCLSVSLCLCPCFYVSVRMYRLIEREFNLWVSMIGMCEGTVGSCGGLHRRFIIDILFQIQTQRSKEEVDHLSFALSFSAVDFFLYHLGKSCPPPCPQEWRSHLPPQSVVCYTGNPFPLSNPFSSLLSFFSLPSLLFFSRTSLSLSHFLSFWMNVIDSIEEMSYYFSHKTLWRSLLCACWTSLKIIEKSQDFLSRFLSFFLFVFFLLKW